jgi:hypothetical protein
LQSGQGYGMLRPIYAIWLLGEDILHDAPDYVHRRRDARGRALLDHGGIDLPELNKVATERVETEQQQTLSSKKSPCSVTDENLTAKATSNPQ